MLLNTNISSNNILGVKIISDSYHTSDYAYSAMYEEYIQNKIDNERRLANHIKQYIPVTESAYKQISAIYEAKLADGAKAKWTKFIEFIKNMFAKFAEKITHLLVDEKKYLEKYKDIILKKTPKEGNEFSIPGDYKVAIDRCINVTVPVFNYAAYKDELKEEDSDSRLVTKIMHNHEGFQYDNGSSLAELFKEYFLAHDKGIKSGTFNDGYLNFTDMYNFCYNTNKIKEITTKDENYLNQSTNAIINAVNEEIRKNAANNNTGTDANSQQEAVQYNSYIMFTEETNGDPKPDSGDSGQNTGNGAQQSDDSKDSLKSNIGPAKNSNAISQMDTYENRSGYDDEKKQNVQDAAGNETEESMNKMLDKWLRVCRAIISAKLTAVQQISSDYMKIIRLHVQSYVGNDKDDADNKSKQTATDYGKGKNNGKNNNAGDNKQAADRQQNGGNNQQAADRQQNGGDNQQQPNPPGSSKK